MYFSVYVHRLFCKHVNECSGYFKMLSILSLTCIQIIRPMCVEGPNNFVELIRRKHIFEPHTWRYAQCFKWLYPYDSHQSELYKVIIPITHWNTCINIKSVYIFQDSSVFTEFKSIRFMENPCQCSINPLFLGSSCFYYANYNYRGTQFR